MKTKKMKEFFHTSPLDRIDRRILQRLQRDGRMTNADLAEAVNVSPATCHRRTQRLFDDGYHPQRARRGRAAEGGARRARASSAWCSTARRRTVSPPSRPRSGRLRFVLDCHLVAGDFDFFLKIRVRDIADFNRLHGEQLIALPGVRQTRTFFVMKEVVDNAPLDF